jgi:hypothetical protein
LRDGKAQAFGAAGQVGRFLKPHAFPGDGGGVEGRTCHNLPRFQPRFIPTSSSRLNPVERWFAGLAEKAVRRGSFQSVPGLMEKIMEFIGSHNKHGDGPLARKKCRLTRAKTPQSIFRPDQDVRNSSAPTGAIRFPANRQRHCAWVERCRKRLEAIGPGRTSGKKRKVA